MNERRKIEERRSNDRRTDRADKNNRRTCPDRRINNIQVEWVPMTSVRLHPLTRKVFRGS